MKGAGYATAGIIWVVLMTLAWAPKCLAYESPARIMINLGGVTYHSNADGCNGPCRSVNPGVGVSYKRDTWEIGAMRYAGSEHKPITAIGGQWSPEAVQWLAWGGTFKPSLVGGVFFGYAKGTKVGVLPAIEYDRGGWTVQVLFIPRMQSGTTAIAEQFKLEVSQ